MMKKWMVAALVLFAAFLYLNNTSYIADPAGTRPVLFAHRAVGQPYSREGLTTTTCTAERILPVEHDYLENTLRSMRAAFEYGADVVEFDVHRTTDNRFVVFHDWTLDCRTNGTGITREHTLDSLQALDIGFGYTADEGETYPFRGQGVGMMPSLEEVLAAFPNHQLYIDVKSQDPFDGQLLARRLAALSPDRQSRIMVYGGGRAVDEIRSRLPRIQTIWPRRLRECLIRYAALGWTGYVPAACERSVIMIPINYAPWMWGWPDRFLQRMRSVGSRVVVIGTYHGEGFSRGIDDPEILKELPGNFAGGIWTDRIDRIGPSVVVEK